MKAVQTLLAALFFLACSHEMPTKQTNETQLPQWAMFGKNLRHTSNAADAVEYYPGPQQGTIVWSWRTKEVFWCSPSIGADGTIYIASSPSLDVTADSGYIYAFNPDGSIKWRFLTPLGNLSTGALGQDGTYFYGSLDQHVHAIDREGNLKWKQKISGFYNTGVRPAITKTKEIILAVGTGVTALHAETGNILWFYEKPMDLGFSVSIDHLGNIYTGTPNSLLALSSEGVKKWEFPVFYGPREIMIGHDGTLYFHILRDSLFYALNPDGTLKWTFKLRGRAENNSPAISSDGSIYLVEVSPFMYKLNLMGSLQWEIELIKLTGHTKYLADSSPIIDKDGTIYLNYGFTVGDNFYAINQNRQVKWSLTIENPSVAIFPTSAIGPDGTLYIAGDHTLNAIR